MRRYGSDRILRTAVAGSAAAGMLLAAVAIGGVGGLPVLLVPLFST